MSNEHIFVIITSFIILCPVFFYIEKKIKEYLSRVGGVDSSLTTSLAFLISVSCITIISFIVTVITPVGGQVILRPILLLILSILLIVSIKRFCR